MPSNELQVTYEATLDIVTYDKKITPAIKVTQGDTCTRFIYAVIKKNGEVLTLDSTYAITINFKRPDQATNVYDAEIQEDGSVLSVLPVWTLETPGDAECDFTISYTDDEGAHKLTTPSISIKVIKACAPNGATAS